MLFENVTHQASCNNVKVVATLGTVDDQLWAALCKRETRGTLRRGTYDLV